MRIVFIVTQLGLAFVYGNLWEWLVHKFVLHGWARNKRSFWSYHWHTHHKNVHVHGLADPDFRRPLLTTEQRFREALGVLGLALSHAWVALWLPWFAVALWVHAFWYLYTHWRSHVDPEWARRRVPWHVDHHFGANPHANWCATMPLFDYLLRTRIRYCEGKAIQSSPFRRFSKSATRVSGTTPSARIL
jgi:hypothetical protein